MLEPNCEDLKIHTRVALLEARVKLITRVLEGTIVVVVGIIVTYFIGS